MRRWVAAALVVLGGGLWASEPAEDAAAEAGDAVAEAEARLVEQKLHLARAYRFRGRREEALELVRQVLAVCPADRRAAQLAVELWLEGWDEQLVRHLEDSPETVVLGPLDEHVEAAAVGSALIDDLRERQDLQHQREVTLIAPYLRPAHAEALAKLVKDGEQVEAVVAASLLSILGDERGDAYITRLLTEGPRRSIEWSPVALLAYTAPAVWEEIVKGRDVYTVRPAVLNLGYAGGEQARRVVTELADSNDMAIQDAAITALMELGEMEEAAKAVHKYRLRYWGGKGHGGVGHKLLIYYARLGDERAFFELFDGFEEDLRTAVARMLAAQMYMAAGRAEDAAAMIRPIVDEAEAAIEAQPEYADPYFRLAQTIAVAGTDPDRAKQTAFAALEHHPGAVLRLEVYALLAELYLKQGKLEQARLLADAAASLYSTEHPRYIGLQRQVNAAGETAPDER